MVQFLSIIFFFLDFFNFCWVFQKLPFFLCHPVYLKHNRGVLIETKMKLVGHVLSMQEVINAYEFVVGQSEGKRPLGRPKRKMEHIKLGIKVIGWEGVGWINSISAEY